MADLTTTIAAIAERWIYRTAHNGPRHLCQGIAADVVAALASSIPESSASLDGRPLGDTPWKRFRDEKPTHDGWGERYLLTWSVRSATYDIGCIDGGWRCGEAIEGHADDLWRWLDVNPERHLAAPAEGEA